MRPADKARRPRILGIFEGGATQPGGMQRQPNAKLFRGHDTRPTRQTRGACAPHRLDGAVVTGQPSAVPPASKGIDDAKSADLELARRCQRGDMAAFEELYRAHASRLYSLALRMTGSEQDAEDLLQEAFLQAHRKLGGFRGESTLGTWLYRLTVNQCLDFLRGRHARMARSTGLFDESGPSEPVQEAPVVPAAISRMDLERSIARLPDGCRAAFVLHDVEGFAHQEVASMLGVSEGTSKSQVHKARAKLRAMLSGVSR